MMSEPQVEARIPVTPKQRATDPLSLRSRLPRVAVALALLPGCFSGMDSDAGELSGQGAGSDDANTPPAPESGGVDSSTSGASEDPDEGGTTDGSDTDGEADTASDGGDPVPEGDWGDTPLGMLADSMEKGTFALLETEGLTNDFLRVSGAATVLQYAGSAAWDKNAGKLYFHGAGHYAPRKFIIYSVETNSWAEGPPEADVYHGYDHNAVDPKTGILYKAGGGGGPTFYTFDGAWSSIAAAPADGYMQITRGIAFVDHLDKLFLFEPGYGGVYLYTPSTDTWEKNGDDMPGYSTYHNLVDYNPNSKAVLFGGGNHHPNEMYLMDENEDITSVAAAPVVMSVAANAGGKLDADPGSGKFVYLKHEVGDAVYEYDPASDAWAAVPVTVPVELQDLTDSVSAPIHGEGVIMYIRALGTPVCYLYKHSD